jgi:hypothetical protein
MQQLRFAFLFAMLALSTISTKSFGQASVTIVGRFRIQGVNGLYYSQPKHFVFKRGFDFWKSKAIRKKDSGYFSMKLPSGYNYLKEIHCYYEGDYFKKLPDNFAELKIEKGGGIYYIGDIVVLWDISDQDESSLTRYGLGSSAGLIGYFIGQAIDNKAKKSALPIKVSAEASTKARFASKLKVDSGQIVTELLHPVQ